MVKKIIFNPITANFDYIEKLKSTNYLGSNCGGTDGSANRTLTSSKPTFIIVDNQFLHLTKDYTHTGSTITFINQIWNDQTITVFK